MRSQNRKVKIAKSSASAGRFAGKVSCVGLLALSLALISPANYSSAFAEEASAPSVQEEIASTIGISFMPTSGSASLSPSTPTGQSAQINVLARVDVQNSGGYTVYLKSDSQNLVGQKDSNHIIPGATVAKTYNAMDVNTWGYYAGEGSSVPEGATYKAISVSGNGDKVAENSNTKIKTDTKNIMLSFAAKINDEKPADTYQNTVTMSVVSSPLQTTLTDIVNMQDMTTNICKASATYETKQLKDIRDGKYYWVTKLADSNCWMTQNLDLDLSTQVALTPDDSDVKVSWTPEYDTATEATAGTVNPNSQIETRSWNLGNYRITYPNESKDCGYPKNSAADCSTQFTAHTTPQEKNGIEPTLGDELAHYILGNHYQWNAATAGTGETITSGTATSSICPKGWKLPRSNATTAGTFAGLINAYSIGTDVAKLTASPLYFVRGGYVHQDINTLFRYAGRYGDYWSSTPYSSTSNAYHLNFGGTDEVYPSNYSPRQFGFSVRCVAR